MTTGKIPLRYRDEIFTDMNIQDSMNATEMILAADYLAAALRKVQPAYRSKAMKTLKSALASVIEGESLPGTVKVLLAIVINTVENPAYIADLLPIVDAMIDANSEDPARNDN